MHSKVLIFLQDLINGTLALKSGNGITVLLIIAPEVKMF